MLIFRVHFFIALTQFITKPKLLLLHFIVLILQLLIFVQFLVTFGWLLLWLKFHCLSFVFVNYLTNLAWNLIFLCKFTFVLPFTLHKNLAHFLNLNSFIADLVTNSQIHVFIDHVVQIKFLFTIKIRIWDLISKSQIPVFIDHGTD